MFEMMSWLSMSYISYMSCNMCCVLLVGFSITLPGLGKKALSALEWNEDDGTEWTGHSAYFAIECMPKVHATLLGWSCVCLIVSLCCVCCGCCWL